MYEVQVADETTGQPFNIQIIRKSSKAVMWVLNVVKHINEYFWQLNIFHSVSILLWADWLLPNNFWWYTFRQDKIDKGKILFSFIFIISNALQISTKLNSRYVYGFGENTHDTLLHDMIYRMWPIFSRGASPGRASLKIIWIIKINIFSLRNTAERFERLRSPAFLYVQWRRWLVPRGFSTQQSRDGYFYAIWGVVLNLQKNCYQSANFFHSSSKKT